jgi:two-component system chemotaxis response regulator CheY
MANIMIADDSDAIRLVLNCVLKEIIEKNSQAKIVLITASDDQKIINQCLQIGASSYISKPFNFNEILKQINDSLK